MFEISKMKTCDYKKTEPTYNIHTHIYIILKQNRNKGMGFSKTKEWERNKKTKFKILSRTQKIKMSYLLTFYDL